MRKNHSLSSLVSTLLILLFIGALFRLCACAKSPVASGDGKTQKPGIEDNRKINQLIYPTLGNPVIVKSGGRFTIEFDPRNREFEKKFMEVSDFRVSVRTSNGPCAVNGTLPVDSLEIGRSRQWPEYEREDSNDRRMYLLSVAVPRSLPRDLYDLTVTALAKGGERHSDSQPHAVQIVDSFKDRYSFCQLTDIHVWGPECFYPSCTYHQRNRRHVKYKQGDGYGAEYYHKAIQQINLMKPDFCIFSGDYVFGQDYFTKNQGPPWWNTTEYEFEMLWFYQETLKLDVPVFMTIGNHDGYNEGEEGAKEDWFENWRMLFGPLYHSFDYGGDHFLALNSMDWVASDRVLSDWFGLLLQPTKYKGQFRNGGDPWNPGVSMERLEEVDESKFSGQLAWIREDLEAHRDAGVRVCVMHHDPWREGGEGDMWASSPEGDKKDFIKSLVSDVKWVLDMGDGEGRLAIIKLMLDNGVSLELSGHEHSDYFARIPWEDGKGEILCVNTTSTQFQSEFVNDAYPGYRRIWIERGKVEGYNYKEPKWSYPWYRGTNVGGKTDLGKLKGPAVSSRFNPADGEAEKVTRTIDNHLEKPVPGAFSRFVMPYLDGGRYYQLENGVLGAARDDKRISPDHRVYEVYTDVAPGESRKVTLRASDEPDVTAPAGSILVNGGAGYTGTTRVTLDVNASDGGGAGLMDMMISNTPDFLGAPWQPYRNMVPWVLSSGTPGNRTVYVKFRDTAMPPNESGVFKCDVEYSPPSARVELARTWLFQFHEEPGNWLRLENSTDRRDAVNLVFTQDTGESARALFDIPAESVLTVNVKEASGFETAGSVSVKSSVPVASMIER